MDKKGYNCAVMNSQDIRKAFLEFFQKQQHRIVPSAPIVNKNDPSLMFTNAGMNQFKDYFLGNEQPSSSRITDTQKCLRVSGKHNDLEEVGFDGYHHTMFEMLGNWSFGDYFKKEAIQWAWKFLTEELKIDKENLYATVFEGDKTDNLGPDVEAEEIWSQLLPSDRIIRASKKDNFWEMGETGPCGPCSEIHIDLRSRAEKKVIEGAELVNKDHPEVIEIWNLVFIQFNRNFEGQLNPLPAQHVDTGMGFERLCMVMQDKTSSYDTDVFTPYIHKIEHLTGKKYEGSYDRDALSDVAFRVVSDHLRAVVFAIADGQIPSNTGAGYVIRRILRRAVRYYYSFLHWEKPLLKDLVPIMVAEMGDSFPELKEQASTIEKVVEEEELSFLRTLEKGLTRLAGLTKSSTSIQGKDAFELYDTYGFPIDLTMLIAEERNVKVDIEGFEKALEEQKNRSRSDAKKEVHDWNVLRDGDSQFIGYDDLVSSQSHILKWRKFIQKGQEKYHIVLDQNPFYAEGGGQVGDQGKLINETEEIAIENTIRENDLFLLVTSKMFDQPDQPLKAIVNGDQRKLTENNHSATHLLHAALKQVLGDHVQQKGSLVTPKGLRFDFSHFGKMTADEIKKVETITNTKIRENVSREEARSIPIDEAKKAGAMMLFGEKYGENVRMITFDPSFSIELCGGCHVDRTGSIGVLKITSESGVASGVRRIEALTSIGAMQYLDEKLKDLGQISDQFKNPLDLPGQVESLIDENKSLKKQIEQLKMKSAGNLKGDLIDQINKINGVNYLVSQVEISDSKVAKDLIHQIEKETGPGIFVFGLVAKEKPQLMCLISQSLTTDSIHAGKWVKNWASHIRGGGGGQPFFATAGGSQVEGLSAALEAAVKDVEKALGQ